MSQRGNVLFLILIAVVLFAALSYAVSRSSSGGSKGISDEKARLGASEIEQYVSLLRSEVERLMITNGCTIENLDWRNDFWKRYDGNPSVGILHTPQSPKTGCAVFSDHGGPVPASVNFAAYSNKEYEATSPNWRVRGGHVTTEWVNRKDEGSDANDIAVIFHGMEHAVCAELLDPATKPTNVIESFERQADPNSADTFVWSGDNQIIDEPANLKGDFFANFNPLAVGPSCLVGAIIVSR